MSFNETFQKARPTCPHCEHQMTTDEMADHKDVDLFALAPEETTACIKCPSCDKEFWIQGGYQPFYTSAFCEEQLS